jgi:acetylornithine deacetylase
LVAHDTESSLSNRALIDEVAAHLARLGVRSTLLPDRTCEKAALLASIGPVDRPGIVLSGHTDVVSVAGQDWVGDPFTLRVADGRAFGRGAVDMKGFLAVCLASVPDFLAAGLNAPIHLLFSYDEETTCLGSRDGIARFGVDFARPAAVIVGEPTDLDVADAHKSVVTFDTTVHGFEAHSSKPDLGANAVQGAALLVAELVRIGEDLKALGDPTGRFDPPCTTVHVGTIAGGTARNIVPKSCKFSWEYRGVPGIDADALAVARLAAFAGRTVDPMMRRGGGRGVVTENTVRVPGLAPDPGSAAEVLALRLAGKNHTSTVPYGTEAGHFQAAGVPTIVCGPGSIDQAHQPNEYITLEALAAGLGFMQRLAARLSA